MLRGRMARAIVLGGLAGAGLAGAGAGLAGCGAPRPGAGGDAGVADAAADAPALDASLIDTPSGAPDLQFVARAMVDSLVIQDDATFREADCEVVEGCVGGGGRRRLLRFTTVSANLGTADLFVGAPPPAGESDARFLWSPCHMHHHVRDYASYELVDAASSVVLTARKQAFCLEDDLPVQPGARPTGYSCLRQGISRGWADVYTSDLPCQWIDVTDVPPGSYTLRIVVNPQRTLPESDYDNNVFTADVPL